jgi:hypothetical protein
MVFSPPEHGCADVTMESAQIAPYKTNFVQNSEMPRPPTEAPQFKSKNFGTSVGSSQVQATRIARAPEEARPGAII